MRLHRPAGSALRLPRRTLRAQLALLYAAVFGTSAAALVALAEIFKPNFLVRSGCQAAPGTASHLEPCSQYAAHLSFAGTISHDVKQNVAGLVMVAVLAVVALGIGWLIAGRVLMLTAASTVRDRVEGLGLGADDYLPKPFDFGELVARIRAIGRRPVTTLPPVLECGDVTLDPSRRVAFRAGRRLDLSPKEFALLEHLLGSAGRVVPTEELLERVWDEAADPFTTAVKQTMHRLRAKLGDPPVICTVREGGYQIGGH